GSLQWCPPLDRCADRFASCYNGLCRFIWKYRNGCQLCDSRRPLVRLTISKSTRRYSVAVIPHWAGDLCKSRTDSSRPNLRPVRPWSRRQFRGSNLDTFVSANNGPRTALRLGHDLATRRDEPRRGNRDTDLFRVLQLCKPCPRPANL